MVMRLFIASGLPPQAARPVKELQAFGKPLLGAAANWVAPETLHLTYVFLGAVTEDRVPEVTGAVERTAGLFKSLTVRLGGLGAFPSFEHPRVLWLGLDEAGHGPLKELACRLSETLISEGFVFDFYFKPHITIARIKMQPGPDLLADLRRKAAELSATYVIRSVEVLQSRASATTGYKILASTRLQ